MTIVNKDDLNRVHGRIDKLQESVQDRMDNMTKAIHTMATSVTRIAATIENMPKAPKQPCAWISEHLQDHRMARKSWKQAIIRSIVHIAELGVVGALAFIGGQVAAGRWQV